MENRLVGFRKLDNLGRVVIPKHIRDKFNIKAEDLIEFVEVESGIYIRSIAERYACIACRSEDNLIPFQGKMICLDCLNLAKKLEIVEESEEVAEEAEELEA